MRDSNENHIFINEKLNHALKKANARQEELEQRLSQYEPNGLTNGNNNSKKSTNNTSGGSSEKIKST